MPYRCISKLSLTFVTISSLLFIRPFNNPTETYRYYSLPFCQSHSTQEEEDSAAMVENIKLDIRREAEKREAAIRHRQRLGESIVGDRRETSPYEITFLVQDDLGHFGLGETQTVDPKQLLFRNVCRGFTHVGIHWRYCRIRLYRQ